MPSSRSRAATSAQAGRVQMKYCGERALLNVMSARMRASTAMAWSGGAPLVLERSPGVAGETLQDDLHFSCVVMVPS